MKGGLLKTINSSEDRGDGGSAPSDLGGTCAATAGMPRGCKGGREAARGRGCASFCTRVWGNRTEMILRTAECRLPKWQSAILASRNASMNSEFGTE
jgi:hypothetical protein